MGLFNGYMKEGPGVSKDAPKKHRFFLFFELFGRKFTKLIQLNMLLFVCLLPMVLGIYLSVKVNPNIISDGVLNSEALRTQPFFVFSGDIIGMAVYVLSMLLAGPAIAGFTYVIRNFQREEHAWVFSDFKDNFKSNFKQAVALAYIDTVVYFLLYVAFVFYVFQMPLSSSAAAKFSPALAAIIAMLAVIYTWMHFYMHIMMVTFELKLKDIFRNALLFALGKFPVNLFITIICAAIILFAVYYLYIGILLAFIILLSLIGYIIVFTVYPTIDACLLEPVTNHEDDEADEDIRDFSDEREE